MDEEWSVDTSAEAVKARMEDLSSQATNLALTSDLEKSSSERVNMFFKFAEVATPLKKDGGYLFLSLSLSYSFLPFSLPSKDMKKHEGPAKMVGCAQKLKAEAERLDVMDKAAGVIAELLFDKNILQQITEYRPLLLQVHTMYCMSGA